MKESGINATRRRALARGPSVASILGRGDFYILCPDNAVTRQADELRMQWAADDIIKDRPALSRWHPDYKEAFEAFMKSGSE